jgi:hypothetical protein
MTTTVKRHIETIRPQAGVPPQSGGIRPPPLPPAPNYKVDGDTVIIASEHVIWYWVGDATQGLWGQVEPSLAAYFNCWHLGTIAFFGTDLCEPVGPPPAFYWDLLEQGVIPFGTLPVEITTRVAA